MSFSYSSGVITQTGTDADLTGLNGLTGVTSLVVDPDGVGSQTIYSVDDSTRLVINGVLNHDPDYEQLIISANPSGTSSAPFVVNGTYNYGVERFGNGNTQYSIGTGLVFTNNGANFYSNFALVNNGTFNWKGGVIKIAGTLVFISGSTLTVDSGTVINASDAQTYQFRLAPNSPETSALMTVNNLTLAATAGSPSRFFTTYSFANAVFKLTNGQVQTWNGNNPEQIYYNFDNAENINSTDLDFSRNSPSIGGNTIFNNIAKRIRANVQNGRYGYCKQFRVVEINPVDLSGSNVSEYSFYGTDFDSGNRVIGVNDGGTDGDGLVVDQDDTDTKVYSSINSTGVYSDSILIEVIDGNNGIITKDDRTDSDTIPIKFISYNESISTWVDTLTGLGTLSTDVTMTPDLSISEPLRATVDSYTEIDTPQKMYDAAKSYLCSNFDVYQEFLLTRNGNLIDANSYDVIIDSTASSAFQFNGTTITIKASEFVGDINTSGNITLLNGAKVLGTTTSGSEVRTTLQYDVNGLIAGSNVQIYNQTKDTEIFIGIVSGTSIQGSYIEGEDFSTGDTISINTANTNGLVAYKENTSTVIASGAGWSSLLSQELSPTYNSNGIDGSTVTGIVLDVPNIHFDIDEADNIISAQEIYAWYKNELMTEEGLRTIYKAIIPNSQYRYAVDPSVVAMEFENLDNVNSLSITNGYFYNVDGSSMIAAGSGNIEMTPNESYVADSQKIQSNQEIINNGVKKSSLGIPHNQDL